MNIEVVITDGDLVVNGDYNLMQEMTAESMSSMIRSKIPLLSSLNSLNS